MGLQSKHYEVAFALFSHQPVRFLEAAKTSHVKQDTEGGLRKDLSYSTQLRLSRCPAAQADRLAPESMQGSWNDHRLRRRRPGFDRSRTSVL